MLGIKAITELSNSCCNYGDSRHKSGFNFPTDTNVGTGKKYGHLTRKCFNKKVQASLHLFNAQEINKLGSFPSSLCASQNLIQEHPGDSNNEEPFLSVKFKVSKKVQA